MMRYETNNKKHFHNQSSHIEFVLNYVCGIWPVLNQYHDQLDFTQALPNLVNAISFGDNERHF